jgi:hypothetical protein
MLCILCLIVSWALAHHGSQRAVRTHDALLDDLPEWPIRPVQSVRSALSSAVVADICHVPSVLHTHCPFTYCRMNVCNGGVLRAFGHVGYRHHLLKIPTFTMLPFAHNVTAPRFDAAACRHCCAFRFVVCLKHARQSTIHRFITKRLAKAGVRAVQVQRLLAPCAALHDYGKYDAFTFELNRAAGYLQLTAQQLPLATTEHECISSIHLNGTVIARLAKQFVATMRQHAK